MCFSAGASFLASVFLLCVGCIALYRAPRGYRMLAAIPLLFAIQQFAEGWLWLIIQASPTAPKGLLAIPFTILSKASKKLSYYMDVKKIVTATFLFFAYVVWPIWIPTAFWRSEKHGTLRYVMLFTCFILGIVVSTTLLFGMLMSKMSGTIVENHIVYTLPNFLKDYYKEGLEVYALAVITPFFISSLPGSSVMGVAILGSLLLTLYIWTAYVTSVWCFFAAILSVLILWFLPTKDTVCINCKTHL